MAARTDAEEMLFYDGRCGFCHWGVRFVVARDRQGKTFRFAPLGGDSFRAKVSEASRHGLPDTIVVLTRDGTLLTRSTAVLHILSKLGGVWKYLGALCGLVPRVLRDWLYDRIASMRHRFFRPPEEACPVLPHHLRSRFDP